MRRSAGPNSPRATRWLHGLCAAIQPSLSDDDAPTPCEQDDAPESIHVSNGADTPHNSYDARALRYDQWGTQPARATRRPHGLRTATQTRPYNLKTMRPSTAIVVAPTVYASDDDDVPERAVD